MTDSGSAPAPFEGAGPEQILYSFGPFGVSVCDGPYGVFKWQKSNTTRIELTDRCIRGVRQRSRGPFSFVTGPGPDRGLLFEIPYTAIAGVTLEPHPAGLGLQKVITITYRDAAAAASVPAAAPRQRSIAAYNDPAARAFALLQQVVPG